MYSVLRYRIYRATGRLLRAGRYSSTRIANGNGVPEVRKSRRFYAPLAVSLGNLVLRVLNTGIRILPRRQWEARERELYAALRRSPVRVERSALILPRLPGRTLADLLGDKRMPQRDGERAVALAVAALADLHRRGFTHADAMAENVLVDLEQGVANWFDFETVHETGRGADWQRADDIRALLATCLVRTSPDRHSHMCEVVLNSYPDPGVVELVAERFHGVRLALVVHLGQAAMPYRMFQQVGTLLSARRESGCAQQPAVQVRWRAV